MYVAKNVSDLNNLQINVLNLRSDARRGRHCVRYRGHRIPWTQRRHQFRPEPLHKVAKTKRQRRRLRQQPRPTRRLHPPKP